MNYQGFLSKLGFCLKNGTESSYQKQYNNYEISINFNETNPTKSTIDFGSKIKVHRKTTCNFSQNESLVVLECVDRLLEKGYQPENIELEKAFKAGHKDCYLDILVKDRNNQSFLMIECKTWGAEYNKEKNNMFKNGGQLLSYFKNDRKVKALCLYASELKNDKIQYISEMIDTDNLEGDNQEELFDSWGGVFNKKGIFENSITAYEFENIGLTYEDLKDLEESDGGTIFNQFAEILRKHIVSDKTNAFNKIFNLFICKIQDEDDNYNNQTADLKFQVKPNEKSEALFDRLNTLYKSGNENYIDVILPDIDETEFEELLKLADNKAGLKETFNELRYYRNSQEFSFKEVYNKETFEENAEIVKEVVRLLENYKIKYSKKHQYLSDFFELLLNTGIKQEAGQFFTPIPLTRFICKSLPIKEIIDRKNDNKEKNFLPYSIDYASGSGHFLTEIMDEIDDYVREIKDGDIKGNRQAIQEFNSYKENLVWSKEYIYGIEKDYRLVKTSKVSSFLNGDGDANVMSTDGLSPFTNPKYKGVLRTQEDKKENPVFDILVANPPYSVSGFKNTIKQSEKCFDLYDSLTENSSEIECLFIERAKQLLKEKSVAGIILPISILTNGGIYIKTREMILKNFDIKAIMSLGSNAFMATGTKTVILFLERKNELKHKEIEKQVSDFFNNYKDVVVNGTQKAFSNYVNTVYDDLDLEAYISILKDNPSSKAKESELYKEYTKLSNKEIRDLEKEKLIYFISTNSQKIVLGDSKEKDIEKEFYGYEFSNAKGKEGIKIYKDENKIVETKLYNPEDLKDEDKMNSYVLKNFNNEKSLEKDIETIKANEGHPLKEHIDYLSLSDLMTFDLKSFDKNINLNNKKKIKIESKYKHSKLLNLAKIKKGSTITLKQVKKGNIPVIAGGKEPAYYHNKANRDFPIISVSASGANAGFVNYFEKEIFASDCSTIKSLEEKEVKTKYIYDCLDAYQESIYSLQRGQAQPHVYPDDLGNIKLPLPPMNIQNKIVADIEKIEKQEVSFNESIKENNEKINNIFDKISFPLITIKNIAKVKGGKRVPKGTQFLSGKSNFPYIRVADFIDGSISLKSIRYISEDIFNKISNYTISNNDLYISIAGTTGIVGTVPKELNNKSLTENAAKIVIESKDKILLKFLYQVMKSFNVQKQIKEKTIGVGTPKLPLYNIENIKIPLPTIEKQEKILKQIEPLEAEIEKAKQYLSTSKELKQQTLDKWLK